MKATVGELPSGEEWAFELKWDGMRIEAICPPNDLLLRSLSGRDVTSSYPELNSLPEALGTSAVFDGEVVVFEDDRPSFGRLQHRIHVETPSQRLVSDHPVVYIVFDLLELDGQSLLTLPYRDRRTILSDFLDDGPSWRVPPIVEGDGSSLLALAEDRGLEGVVAKRLSSLYQPGTRTPHWLKVKVRLRQEFVVVGWLPGQGTLDGQIGSLLLAVWDDGRLRFAGAVGSGLGDRDRAHLTPLLIEAPCPFDDPPRLAKPPTWTQPTIVAEIEYGSWPADSLLRHPVYAGLLPDHDPSQVVRESAP